MGTEQSDLSAPARKSANWRKRMQTQGKRTFRVQLPRTINEQIRSLQAQHKISSLGEVLDQIVRSAADEIQPSQLVMPPVFPKTESVHDITTVLSRESLAYLARIKAEIGLPRAKAIHAILLTKKDVVERPPSMTETVFLDTRFKILTGVYAPGHILDREAIAEAVGCCARVVLDALCALVAEGYVVIAKRGIFAVRIWDEWQLQDHYEIWASLSAMGAARAAERASPRDLASAVGRLSKPDSFDFSLPASTERHIHEFAVFNAELVRLSQNVPLLNIAPNIITNSLLRKGIYASSSKQLMADRHCLEIVGWHLLDRNSIAARAEVEKLILRPMPGLIRETQKTARAAHKSRKGIQFGLGKREPALDGMVRAFGITLADARSGRTIRSPKQSSNR